MKSGDDEKQLAPILVVPRLAITSVDAVITPPKYAGVGPSTIDLRTEAGQQNFRRLMALSDVVLDNNRKETMERLGITRKSLRAARIRSHGRHLRTD